MHDIANETSAPAPTLADLSINRQALAPMRRRRRRWVWWVLGAIVLLAIAATAFGPRKFEVQVASVVNAYPTQ